ncbi:CoA-binding protein [Haloflavibacter putidus]|uniref:CoA-binding protein n=1 Tax=Haloflavibacter putidus TaxID=2576776 RepID=A0A507ZD29_9FLAO|nr:CoA-binding protein [Haloflavibacter putidus]TQD33974.1 CoA-binding protein [Haloflavibacter putidus]
MEKKTLVIGASLKTSRYSNMAIKKLRKHKVPTLALGLRKGVVEDVLIETENLNFENVDTVTLYLNPKRQKEYYDYILALQPERVIFNPGTENPEFYEKLRKAGIEVLPACTLVLLSTNQY